VTGKKEDVEGLKRYQVTRLKRRGELRTRRRGGGARKCGMKPESGKRKPRSEEERKTLKR
jgi:hypothetical protein